MTTSPLSTYPCDCGRLHVIGYVRLSNLTETTTSPERQREQITAYCVAKGWHLVDIVEDLGESGSSVGKGLDRPGLARIRAEWDQYDVMVAAKLDRIARNVADFSRLVDEAKSHGATLATVEHNLDLTTSTGVFVAQIMAAFAAMEAAQIRERVTAMRADARINHVGRFMGGAVPFGYRKAKRPEGGLTLVIDEAEAELVREAARRILAGDTLYGVSTDWNARGIATKYGKRWMGQTVRNMLTGHAVIGAQSHKGEPLRDEHGMIREVFPPVLDRSTWDQLRRRLVKPVDRKPSRRLPALLLAGIAVCDECGTKFYARRKGGNRRDRYECGGARTGKGCGVGSVIADDLDAEVIRQLMDRAGWHLVIRRVEVATDNTDALAEVQEAITETTRRLAEDDGDEADTLARLSDLKARRAVLRQTPEVTEEAEPLGTLRDYWKAADFAERVRLLRELLDDVKVSGINAVRGELNPDRVALNFKPDVLDTEAATELYGTDDLDVVGHPILVVGGKFRSLAGALVRATERGAFGDD